MLVDSRLGSSKGFVNGPRVLFPSEVYGGDFVGVFDKVSEEIGRVFWEVPLSEEVEEYLLDILLEARLKVQSCVGSVSSEGCSSQLDSDEDIPLLFLLEAQWFVSSHLFVVQRRILTSQFPGILVNLSRGGFLLPPPMISPSLPMAGPLSVTFVKCVMDLVPCPDVDSYFGVSSSM